MLGYCYYCLQHTVNSLYCRHPQDLEVASLIAKVRNSENLFQMSVIKFCLGFSCCPYYRDVCNSEVSARRELTVLGFDKVLGLRCTFTCRYILRCRLLTLGGEQLNMKISE